MKFLVYMIMLPLLMCLSFQKQNVKDSIANELKSNNVSGLAKHFSSSIKLVINKEENVVTKFQAERILQDYLRKNKIEDIVNIKENNQNSSSQYFIYELKKSSKLNRVVVKLIDIKNTLYISELRVE